MGENSRRSCGSFIDLEGAMMLNIAAMPAQIEIYEQMSALSTRMVEAARANDWDLLIDLERSVASMRDTFLKDADTGSTSPNEASRKRELIQRILRDDAEVRRHTEPWMEHVRHFLSGGNRKRQVDRAYGAGS